VGPDQVVTRSRTNLASAQELEQEGEDKERRGEQIVSHHALPSGQAPQTSYMARWQPSVRLDSESAHGIVGGVEG